MGFKLNPLTGQLDIVGSGGSGGGIVNKPLPQNDILVGGSDNTSKQVNTSSNGDILADETNGLTLKASVAGSGLSGGGGSPLAVNTDNSTLEVNSDTLRIKDAGVTSAKLAAAVAGNGLTGGAGSALAVGAGTGITVAADTVSVDTTTIATISYVDNAINGLDWKQSVRVGTTVAGTLASSFQTGSTIDGILLVTGDRILIKNQVTGADNGIYTVQVTGAPVRSTDADTSAEVTAGMAVFIEEGSTNADSGWVLTTDNPIVLGTTPLVFAQFTGAGQITAGAGLSKTGNTLDVNVDSSTIEIVADTLQVKDSGITSAKLAASVAGNGLSGGGGSALSVNVDGSTLEIVTDTLQVKDSGITNAKVASGIDAVKIGAGSVDNTEFSYLDGVTSAIQTQFTGKVTANGAITGATHTKITYDSKGLVTAGSDITATDIPSGIDATKIGAGSVDNTEFGYLDGVTSAIQTQITGKANTDLGNLTTTSVNQSLIPSATTKDLGTVSLPWQNQFLQENRLVDTSNSGFIREFFISNRTLTANVGVATVFSPLNYVAASYNGALMTYRIAEATSNKVRTGTFMIANNTTVMSFAEEHTDADGTDMGSASGLSWTATITSGSVQIAYNNTHATNVTTMSVDVKLFPV